MKLDAFLRAHYQDLDGVSRFGEIERIGRIARQLAPPSPSLDRLILFQGLGNWLEKLGNLSRVLLAVPGLTEGELRQTAASIRRLDDPQTEEERAVAAAVLIDRAGPRGFAERIARSRREGHSIEEIAREPLATPPAWMQGRARELFLERCEARKSFAAAILEET